jgi:N-terminal domain of galactosyltransferase
VAHEEVFSPYLSVLIPWCNREEIGNAVHLNQGLFNSHGVEVLLINCGGDTSQLHRLLSPAVVGNLRHIEIPRVRFNKSLALNIGVFFSRAHSILILDADIILKSDFLAAARILTDKSAFVTLARVRESIPEYTWPSSANQNEHDVIAMCSLERIVDLEFAWSDGTTTHLAANHDNAVDGTRAGPGILMVKKEDLLAIDGYNSELELWGWEDNDVQLRLQAVLARNHVEYGDAVHLSHGDERRVLQGRQRYETNLENFSYLCKRYSTGNLSGTYSQDVVRWKKVVCQVPFIG